MKLILKIFLVIILLVIIGGVLLLGYLGFIPGISTLFGADKPQDLGVRYSAQDLQSAREKSNVQRKILPPTSSPAESVKYSGQQSVNTYWTDKEITALLDDEKSKYFPISNAQIKFNQDDTVEFSANLRKDQLPGYIQAAFGVSSEKAKSVTNALKFIPANPPLYLKFNAEVINNNITTLNVQKLKIGKFSVPPNISIPSNISVSPNISDTITIEDLIISLVERRFTRVPGFFAKSVRIENKTIKFNGTLFKTLSTVRE